MSYSWLQWRESLVSHREEEAERDRMCQEDFEGCVGVSWMRTEESQSSSKGPCPELKSVDSPMCLGTIDVARSTEKVQQETLPLLGA